MSINLSKKQTALAVAVAIMVMFLFFILGSHSVEPAVEVQEVVKYVEVIPENNFDTSILESWDGDFSDGKIRMIGAWLYGQDNNGDPIVVDEKGELYSYYVDKYNNMEKSLGEYKKLERTFAEFDKCEVASMLVLKDYFGFARIRLMRFVDKARTYFKGASWKLYEEQIKYLEKLCHKKFTEFKAVKGGKGVLWYGEGEAYGNQA